MNAHPLNLNRVRIRSTGFYLPSQVRTNDELVEGLPTSSRWIVDNLGIWERRMADEGQYTSDLAASAGLDAIANAGLDSDDINLIILATATPDRKAPSAACIAQAKMGISNHCAAFDVAAACSGFLYGLTTGALFIQSGAYDHVLVIGADTFSKITDWHHRHCVFFGDAAGAVLLERNGVEEGFFSSILFADGTGMDHFTVYPDAATFTMDAGAVYRAATTLLPEAMNRVLSMHRLRFDDISMIVPHQPSIRVLRRVAEVLGIDFGLIKTNLAHYANTAGATIPLLLAQLNEHRQLNAGDLVLFAAIGAGWTWGATLYRWN